MPEKPTYEELEKRVRALEQAEKELAQLFALSLDMICIADIDTATFVKVNPAFTETLGYSEKALLDTPFLDFVHPDDVAATRTVIEQQLKSGQKVINFENRYRCADGGYRWLSWVSHPVVEQGVTYAIARDITASKQKEAAFRESKDLLDATGRMARVGGWELDADTLEVLWTDETYRIHDVPLGQKPPLEEAINFFHPEDRPELEQAIRNALRHGEPYDLEVRFITAGGKHLWTRTVCEPEIRDGKVVKLKGTFQDITQRKQAEEKYKESVLRLREAIKAGKVGLWDWDLVTNTVYYSTEWKRQIGYAEHEIAADLEEWRKRVHPDDLDRTLERIQKSIDEVSQDHSVEFRFQHKDGSYRWIMAHSSIIVDENGQPVRMLGSHTDITEQKTAAELARQSEHKLRSVLDSTPFPIAIVDTRDEKILYWSRSAHDLFGHTAPTAAEWYRIAYPDLKYRQSVIERWKPILAEARKSKETVNAGEYEICCQDGSVRICELYARFLPDALIVTFNDITRQKQIDKELKKKETQFRQVFEHVGIGIALYQPVESGDDFIFADINPAGARIGRKPRSDHIGKSVLEIYPGVRQMGLFKVFQEVYRSGITRHYPVSNYLDNHIELWVDNYISRLPSGEIMAVYEDVTLQKKAEESLKNLNLDLEKRVTRRTRKLEETSRELENFVYSVSHDLRAPLRSISGFAEIIARRHKKSLNQEGQHYFDNIITASRQMGDLIDDLLKFSRLGRKAITLAEIPLGDVFAASIKTLSGQIAQSRASINVPDRMPSVLGDFTLVNHIMINLLENAIKYHRPATPPIINVTCETKGRAVIIAIADNGLGIEPEYHEKIFNIFQRLHSQTDYPGTGIGLAAVRKAVQIIGGKVAVQSAVGEGSVFKIEMPMAL